MASRQIVSNVCRKCQAAFKSAAERLRVPCIGMKYAQKSFRMVTTALVFCEAKQKLDLQAPDKNRLKQEHMLKAASANAADTTTTLLSQTAYSLIETEQKYRDMVATLIELVDYHMTVLGNEEEEERVTNIIAEARDWLQTYLKHIEDLEELLSSVQKLADASAEVAFLAGSEFTSTSLGERVYSASRHIDSAREQRRQVEAQLEEVEANFAKAKAKHAEKEERRKKAEDAMFGTDLFEEEREEEGQEKPAEKDLFDEEFAESAENSGKIF